MDQEHGHHRERSAGHDDGTLLQDIWTMNTNDVIDAFVGFLETRPDIRTCGMPVFIGTCTPEGTEVGVLLGGADILSSIHDVLLVRMAAHLCRQRATSFGVGSEILHQNG